MWLLNFIIVATLFTVPCRCFDLGRWMSWCSDSRMNTDVDSGRSISPDCEDKLAAAEKLIENLTQQMMEKDSEIDLLKTQLTENEEHLTRVRRQGGLPQCQTDLQACQAQVTTLTGQLSTCNTALTTCNNNLNTCTTTSNACTGSLATCNGQLTTCNGNLATCTSTSNTCAGNLATCSSQLTTCNTNLNTCRATSTSTCPQDLINCRSMLATCRGGCANQLGIFTFTKLSSGTYLFSTTQLNWYGARDYCRKYDMELTSIGSEAEALAIKNHLGTMSLGSQSLYWTGINNLGGTLTSVGMGGRTIGKLALLMAMINRLNSNNKEKEPIQIFDKLPGQCIAFGSTGQFASFRLQPTDCNHLGHFICKLPAHCVV